MVKREETIEVEGTIIRALPNTMFRVQLDATEEEQPEKVILCTLS